MAISNTDSYGVTPEQAAPHPEPNVTVVRDDDRFLAVQDHESGARFTFERRARDGDPRLAFLDVTPADRCPTDVVIPESVAIFLSTNDYRLASATRYAFVDSPLIMLDDLVA